MLRNICDGTIDIARRAGEIMLDSSDPEVMNKGTKDNHVTEIDLKVQQFLKKELLALLPGSTFVGEEEDDDDRSSDDYWIVDPIDGTTNFIRNLQMSVVSIALIHSGEPVMGVVYNPYTDEMFYALKGNGSFRNGKKIKVSDRKPENCIFATSWGAYDKSGSSETFRISEKIYGICEDIRRMGSAAYELCKTAEGSIDLYYEPILHPWDHAAAGFILTEAGGIVSSVYGEQDLFKRNSVIAANNPDNLEFLRKIIIEEKERKTSQ